MVASRQPDLVILDFQLPGINVLQTMAIIRTHHPATRVIITTADDSDAVQTTCVAQGSNGVISKGRLDQELGQVIAAAFSASRVGRSFKTPSAQ